MVYLFLADGFEEIEALTQVDYLKRAEIDVKMVGVTGEYILGAHGIQVKSDIGIDDVEYTGDVKMLILPGGLKGMQNLWENKKVISMVEGAYADGKYVAAICASPTIFAKMGILKGKKATCYPDMQDELVQNGAKVKDESVVSDGNIITARAAGASEEFAFELIKVLKGKEQAEKVGKSICAR